MSDVPHYLMSPGHALTERARIEVAFNIEMAGVLSDFLAGVSDDAHSALLAPVMLAAGNPHEPFTLGAVLRRWDTVAARFAGRIRDTLVRTGRLDPASELYLEGAMRRLVSSPVPLAVHDSVRSVLSQSMMDRWSRTRTIDELMVALSPTTGSAIRTADGAIITEGMTWQSSAERIARTEATASYGFSTLNDLSAAGMKAKRWVSHHDRLVRPDHLAADGSTVGIDQPFVVGGYYLAVPGDPNGPDSQTANCRCVMVGVR